MLSAVDVPNVSLRLFPHACHSCEFVMRNVVSSGCSVKSHILVRMRSRKLSSVFRPVKSRLSPPITCSRELGEVCVAIKVSITWS